MMRGREVPLSIIVMFMAIAIPENIEAEYTSNGDSNLASHVHLLVQESVDSGSPPVVDDVILVKHSFQMMLQGV